MGLVFKTKIQIFLVKTAPNLYRTDNISKDVQEEPQS